MPDCNSCKENRSPAQVPYFVYEAEMYRADRLNGRIVVLCILLACMFALSNLAWVVHEFGGEKAAYTETDREDAAG